jgi:hypothetical protein
MEKRKRGKEVKRKKGKEVKRKKGKEVRLSFLNKTIKSYIFLLTFCFGSL